MWHLPHRVCHNRAVMAMPLPCPSAAWSASRGTHADGSLCDDRRADAHGVRLFSPTLVLSRVRRSSRYPRRCRPALGSATCLVPRSFRGRLSGRAPRREQTADQGCLRFARADACDDNGLGASGTSDGKDWSVEKASCIASPPGELCCCAARPPVPAAAPECEQSSKKLRCGESHEGRP